MTTDMYQPMLPLWDEPPTERSDPPAAQLSLPGPPPIITAEHVTGPLGMHMLIDLGILMAGAALAAIPIIIVFLAFQKYFTQGITMGAVKG